MLNKIIFVTLFVGIGYGLMWAASKVTISPSTVQSALIKLEVVR